MSLPLSPQEIARNSLARAGYKLDSKLPTPSLSDTYTFYGSNAEILAATETEVVSSGGAGTGKSLAWLAKLHRYALEYKQFRGLIIRKTRVSLTNSGLVTFEKHVLGDSHPLVMNGPTRQHRDSYLYDNGSEISIGGMDNPTRIMSTEWDMIFVQEAVEISEEDADNLSTRLRNGRAPIQQLGMDTNPGAPMHWLKQRCDKGRTRMIFCRHEDNPILYDHATQTWTERGLEYLAKLDALTGARKQRLRFGLWTQAEDIIFDNWSEDNVSTDAEYNPNWTVRWFVDDGYVHGQGRGTASYHPRVILFANITPQGFIYIFDEYYATGELSEVSINNALAMPDKDHPYNLPEIAFVDSSAQELITRIHLSNIQASGMTHPVGEGIKNVRRFICDPQGVRMLKVHPRCVNLIREMVSYQYDEKSRIASAGERKPLQVDDHGPSCLRYGCWPMRFND
jgi:PBSX family phage terminase large subunit